MKKTLILTLLICLIFSLSLSTASAATNSHDGYAVFSAACEGQGIYVNWGVDCNINVYYNNYGLPYNAYEFSTCCYISPPRGGGIGNGEVIGIFTEVVDFNSSAAVVRNTQFSNDFSPNSVILPSPSHLYFALECDLNEDFMYQFEEEGYFFFTYSGANIYYNRSYTGTVYVNTPK